MTDLTALIDQVESAAAGSRELDVEVWEAVDAENVIDAHGDQWDQETLLIVAPAYTTRPYDLTASVVALPEGWEWSVDDDGLAMFCRERMGGWQEVDPADLYTLKAATPALAMTAAMLRAHHSEREKQRWSSISRS